MNGISGKSGHRKYRLPAAAAGSVFLAVIILFLSGSLCACDTYSEIKRSIINKFSAEDDMDEAVEVVNEFFGLLSDRNYEEAYQYLSNEDKSRGKKEDFYDEFEDITDIVSIDVKEVEINNNVAVVCIDLTDFYDGEEKVSEDIEVSLVREEEEEWKIVFWE
ncbi:MAG: hypothetical protein U9O59_07165 [Actinomycetota bacterium]|nr:hypothetical protein [Actinomycetota bacterium]